MASREQQVSAIRKAAEDYVFARGWRVVRIEPGGKKPLVKEWQRKKVFPGEFRSDENLGVLLGKPSGGLVDLDLDMQEARDLADAVFGPLPAFGRPSVGYGHRLFTCPNHPGCILQFRITNAEAAGRLLGLEPGTDNKTVLVELRAKEQTVFPPSTHASGEQLAWRDLPQEIPERPWVEMEKNARLLAFLGVVSRAYPRVAGNRHNIAMALTGALLDAGQEPDRANELVTAVATLAGDEEERGIHGAETQAKIEAGEPYWGLPKLLEDLGLEDLEKDLRKILNVGPKKVTVPANGIVVRPGELPQTVDQAEAALLKSGAPFCQRGGEPVEVARVEGPETDPVHRTKGSLRLFAVGVARLREAMAKAAPWFAETGKGGLRAIDPPKVIAETLLARRQTKFPVLRAVLNAPTMDVRTGRVIENPGYDTESRLLLDIGDSFPKVPEAPGRTEAEAALGEVRCPLRGFSFASDVSLSVAVAAMLTAIVRAMMRTCPGFGITAPVAGTGKSLLAETVGTLATGHAPPAMSQGKTPEEDEKRLAVALRAGDPVLLVDNCERPVEGDFLCSLLSQETVQARILGKSERVLMPTTTMVMATGNNLVLAGDAARRFVLCHLDAQVERPDQREFDFDPREEVLAEREALVVAVLTVLRAYHLAGRPGKLKPFGSFPDWDLVRGALVWLGLPDPAESREAVFENDPRRGELLELLTRWKQTLGDREVTLAELRGEAFDEKDPKRAEKFALMNALIELSGKPTWNARSIGWKLRRRVDRVVGGLVLRGTSAREGQRWRVEGELPENPPKPEDSTQEEVF